MKAVLILGPDQTLDAAGLNAWAWENMATYKTPRETRFVDQLPRSPAGKLLPGC